MQNFLISKYFYAIKIPPEGGIKNYSINGRVALIAVVQRSYL